MCCDRLAGRGLIGRRAAALRNVAPALLCCSRESMCESDPSHPLRVHCVKKGRSPRRNRCIWESSPAYRVTSFLDVALTGVVMTGFASPDRPPCGCYSTRGVLAWGLYGPPAAVSAGELSPADSDQRAPESAMRETIFEIEVNEGNVVSTYCMRANGRDHRKKSSPNRSDKIRLRRL